MSDLSTRYLGLELRSPLVASASPFTGRIEHIAELAAAGVGAVVLPSLFEEQILREGLGEEHPWSGMRPLPGRLRNVPGLDDYNSGTSEYVGSWPPPRGTSTSR